MSVGIISPAIMKLFISCPMKFYFKYVENVSSPQLDRSFVVGKIIHAIASYYLQNSNVESFLSSLTEKEISYFNFLKNNEYFNLTPLAIEKSLSIKLGNYWIGGRPDAVVKNNLNDYYILDYKTGGISDDMTYDYQTMVYLLAVNKFYKNYNSLSFVYIDLKNCKSNIITFDNNLKSEYEVLLLKICDEISNFNKLKFKKKCNSSCEYSKLCICY